jgi:hypothetical protein
MSRYPQPSDGRGSLRWIQHFVNDRSAELDAAIHAASDGRLATPIDWRSPRREDDFAEYRDGAFLDLLGIELGERSLASFWPRMGPQWDALGVTASGEPILVEAKANIPEISSPPTAASGASREVIVQSLRDTADHLDVDADRDWTRTYYQYANRLAHLYLLHELNRIDGWLVFVYFVGDADVGGPESVEEWREALVVLHDALGLMPHPLLERKVDVFVEVG